MLKAYFDIFEITEEQLTEKAITRLKFTSFVALFLMPATTFMSMAQVSGVMRHILMGFIVFALICFGYVGMSRASNRFWVPDKFLDEGEIERKRGVWYATFISIMTVAFMALLGFIACEVFLELKLTGISTNDVLYYTLGNLLMSTVCLQAFFTARDLQPLDADIMETSPARTAIDKGYKYVACAFVFFMLVLPVILGPVMQGQ